jgi:putative Mn2+ efflux pump MntP
VPWHKLLILGIIIGSNNLAASLALGALGRSVRRLRVVVVFAVFEFFVPLLGILLGRQLVRWVADAGLVVSVIILVVLGLLMIRAGFREPKHDEAMARRLTTWKGLLALALGLSMDNLIIGISLGLGGRIAPLTLACVIAICSATFTWIGLTIGDATRRMWEQVAQVGSGVLLLLLAGARALGWV